MPHGGGYYPQRDERESRESLRSGTGFVDEDDYERLRQPYGKSKASIFFSALGFITMGVVLAVGVMYFLDFSHNYHDGEKLDRLLENQQSLEEQVFFQLKVLQALYGNNVTWPPLIIGQGGLGIPSPSPSPSPTPSPGLRRDVGEQSLPHLTRNTRFNSRAETLDLEGAEVGVYQSLEEFKISVDNQLEVREASFARENVKTNGEFLYDIHDQIEANQYLFETIIKGSSLVEEPEWPQWSRDANGHVHASPAVSNIDLSNVQTLTTKCDLSNGPGTKAANAMVTVRGDLAYVSNKDTGDMYCYNRFTCTEVWHVSVEQIFEDHIPAAGSDAKVNASISNIPSRHSPSLYRTADGAERLIFGAPSDRFGAVMNGDAFGEGLSTYIISLDAYTGEYAWHTKTSDSAVPEDFMAHYAGSPTIEGNAVYFGTSSFTNVFTAFGLPCTFIGSLAKYSLEDGSEIWKTYTLPTGLDPGNWCGASVWARISVDPELGANGLVISGTGNTHYHPESVETCYATYDDDPTLFSAASIACHADAVSTYNHPILSDSMFALDLANGSIVWSFTPGGLDTFNTACPSFGFNPRNGSGLGCHGFKGPDWDFAGSFPIVDFGDHKRVMGGSKSGMAWGLNALTGEVFWAQDLGPGGTLGGVHWSGSYNPKTNLFYAANSGDSAISGYDNAVLSSFNVITDNTWVCNGGTVHAIDVLSGNIVWQTYDPHANVSLDGVGTFPESCWEFSSNSFAVERFKDAWPRFNSAGAELNSTNTATLGIPCNVDDLTGPEVLANPTFARIHGVASVTDEVLAVPSITGNMYMLDASTGNCVHHVSCPDGAIYGGATLVDNQMIVQCGYGSFVPEWIGPGNGNVTRIFELA